MRLYVEALEVVPEGSPPDYVPEFVRLDATGRDVDAVVDEVLDLLDPSKRYVVRLHYCRHDETPKKACGVKVLREVG